MLAPKLMTEMRLQGLRDANELLREAREKYVEATNLFAESNVTSKRTKSNLKHAFELTDEANRLTRLAFQLMHADPRERHGSYASRTVR